MTLTLKRGGASGLWIAPPGTDPRTCDEEDLIFSSGFFDETLKHIAHGVVTIAAGTPPTGPNPNGTPSSQTITFLATGGALKIIAQDWPSAASPRLVGDEYGNVTIASADALKPSVWWTVGDGTATFYSTYAAARKVAYVVLAQEE